MEILKGDKGDPRARRTLQAAVGLGYQFLAATAIFVGSGYYLDQRRGGGSLYTLIGVGFTFLYGAYEVWKLVRYLSRREETDGHPQNHDRDSSART